MARSKAKTNTGTNTGTNAQTDAGNAAGGAGLGEQAKKPAGLWGSDMSPDDFVKQLPGWSDKLPRNEAGVKMYFQQAGAEPAIIQQWMDAAKTNPKEALDAAAVWASSQGKFKDAAGVETKVGNEAPASAKASPATPAAATAAGEGQSPQEKGKPNTSWKRATPAMTRKLMEAVSGGAPAGGLRGGTLKSVEYRDGPGGQEFRLNFRKGDLEKNAAEASAQGSQGLTAEQALERGQQPTSAEPDDVPDPGTPEGRAAIREAEELAYKKRGQNPPSTLGMELGIRQNWPNIKRAGAVLGLSAMGGMGAAYMNYLLGGKDEDKNRPSPASPAPGGAGRVPVPNPYLDLTPYGNPGAMPAAPAGNPYMDLAPPSGSSPQQIPAGTPAPTNTTLLERMMRSREYV